MSLKPLSFLFTLAALLLFGMTERPARAEELRTFCTHSASGVTMEYKIDVEPFGGMYTANYYFTNNNGYAVNVEWAVHVTFGDGTSDDLKFKGPLKVRAGGKVRTGWADDGDVFERKGHGLPRTVTVTKFDVTRA